MPRSKIPILVASLVLVSSTALSTAAADGTVDPDPSPPPVPGDLPPPNLGDLVDWGWNQAGQLEDWSWAVARDAEDKAWTAVECTWDNVWGNCPYVVVADETDATYYMSASKHPGQNGVWQEANGCEGLQRDAVDCRGGPTPEPADDRIV